jgi:enoyl-CoA hydratase/carnithine racemase
VGHIEEIRTGAVLGLTLSRPDKKNALTNAMYGDLADAFERARDDAGVRCVLITGSGDTFTSGNDLGDFAAIASGDLKCTGMHVHRFLAVLSAFEKPIVAAVPGLAIGIGTTLLLHCDLVFLAETATLAAPFVDLALVPEAGSSLLLQARIGYVRAFAMFALGERIDAATSLDWGLANRIVPSEMLQAQALAAATLLASKPPGAVAITKRLMRDAETITNRIEAEMSAFEMRLRSPEAREAFMAFAERRKPDFSPF